MAAPVILRLMHCLEGLSLFPLDYYVTSFITLRGIASSLQLMWWFSYTAQHGTSQIGGFVSFFHRKQTALSAYYSCSSRGEEGLENCTRPVTEVCEG